jgi:hypothetical protein
MNAIVPIFRLQEENLAHRAGLKRKNILSDPRKPRTFQPVQT